MSSGSEPGVASTVLSGASSASCAPALTSHLNPGELAVDTNITRRSSHSSTRMGSSFSKSNTASLSPAGPPPSPTTSRGFSAAVAGGLRLTRAFANRRKKSQDVSKVMDRSISQTGDSPPNHTQRIEATASISSSPAQLATQVLRKAVKKPQPTPTLHQHQEPIPPSLPPKPQHVSPQPRPPSPPPKPSADLRSSIIPISPGISSAVNYIRMTDEPLVDRATQLSKATSKEKPMKEHLKADKELGKGKDAFVDSCKEGGAGSTADKDEMKDAWRKSDSTMSYHTIRPGSQPSRPVSMAESLQSNYTVVPVKRQSALITDADFCVTEEDSEKSAEGDHNEDVPPASSNHSPTASVRIRERRAMSLLNNPVFHMTHKLPPTPTSATAANFTFSVADQRVASPSQRTSANAQGYIASSDGYSAGGSIRTQLAVYNTQPQSQPHLQIATSFISHNSSLPTSPIPIQHPRNVPNNPYTTFPPPPDPQAVRPGSRLDRSLPALPAYVQRQPTLSMSGGLGLAKRAVEKMGFGRALGLGSSSSSNHGHSQISGYSSSSSGHTNSTANTPSSSYGTQSYDTSLKHGHSASVYDGLAAPRSSTSSNSGQSSHGTTGGYLNRKNRPKHAPCALSVSSTASQSTSASDSDAMEAPSGPNFGKTLRGPLRRGGGGGVVFGRDLKSVVKETAVGVGKPKGWGGRWRNWDSTTSLSGGEEYDGDSERAQNREELRTRKGSVRRGQLKALEDRKLPALVVRCAQHLLIWGIQEEGLFRIPGRALHVSRLRAEFDSGADFDMTECSPGDVDPHAVASVFKAFLRELPEPILTTALLPYFDAAMAQENKDAEGNDNSKQSRSASRGPGLPSCPRDSSALPSIRKAPSLSTLAMPTMTGLRPLSNQLLDTFRSLLAQLPEENRDLIRTVSELIKAVALDSVATKMPLSNLLLVFCPSLNMSPPLLRTLCEAEGIWEMVTPESKRKEEDDDDELIVLDTRQEEGDEESYEDARDEMEEDGESLDRLSEDLSSSVGYNASTEDVSDSSLTLFPLKPEVHGRKASVTTSSLTDGSSYISTSEGHCNPPRLYFDVHSQSVSRPHFSSSAESLNTAATSSHDDSLPNLPKSYEDECKENQHKAIADVTVGSRSSQTTTRRLAISNPVLVSGPIQFPSIAEKVFAPQAQLGKRRSIPMLSLPNLTLKTSSSDSPISPTASLADRPKRMKKPSLPLLFQKKSSSFSSPKLLPAQSLKPAILNSYLPSRSASDSSVSTPLSSISAPQATTATLQNLPPKLNTPIESSTLSIGMGLGIDSVESSATFTPESRNQMEQAKHPSVVLSRPLPVFPVVAQVATPPEYSSQASSIVRPGSTPIADRYHRAASPSPSLVLRSFKQQASQSSPSECTALADNHLCSDPTPRLRGVSTSSSASSNHLGLLDEDIGKDDWSKIVLRAADSGTNSRPGV